MSQPHSVHCDSLWENEIPPRALKKYETLRQNIFNNRGDNYLKVLMRLPKSFDYYNKEISEKYSAFAGPKKTKQGFIQDNKSQWRGKIIPLTSVFIFIYVFIKYRKR